MRIEFSAVAAAVAAAVAIRPGQSACSGTLHPLPGSIAEAAGLSAREFGWARVAAEMRRPDFRRQAKDAVEPGHVG